MDKIKCLKCAYYEAKFEEFYSDLNKSLDDLEGLVKHEQRLLELDLKDSRKSNYAKIKRKLKGLREKGKEWIEGLRKE